MIYNLMSDSYKTISKFHREEQKILNSRFIATAYPILDKDEADKYIKSIHKEFFNAHHHPYAYKLYFDKEYYKFSDDGEPSGTSGKPILNAIDKYCLTNIILIITRFFGGTKLGTGGLKHAYFDTADLCLSKCEIIEKYIEKEIYLEFDYTYLNPIMNLLIKKKIRIKENKSDFLVKMSLYVKLSLIDEFKKELINITRNNIKIIII